MNLHDLKSVCGSCTIRELCLPAGLSDEEVHLLDQHMEHRQVVSKGDYLYRVGDPFRSLFAISSGFFKTVLLHEDGRGQITGFQMMGELLGLEAIHSDHHVCDAVALEDSAVCTIPFDQFEQLGQVMVNLQHRFNKNLSREIVREHNVMMLLGSMRSEERLANFLIDLANRHAHRHQSSVEMTLRMTREDIGSYLGLKLETVSRLLSRFHDEGLLEVRGRRVKILDRNALALRRTEAQH
ncbi:MAG: helix-turn-helix domain-containing protein [Ferrovum sp.]|jgi:CRP/FNR family transcriptional regulator|nr:helix-turn-helix domain-containing protein [Ferrovum sp.]NDU89272.1 helix-turn-helix domain-containing protein [Ferrovum sp.]